MNRLLVKILLAMLMFPLTLVLFIGVFLMVAAPGRGGQEEFALVASCVVSALFAVCYWLVLWRDTVNWTSTRIQGTVGAGFGGAVAGLVVFGFMVSVIPYDGEYVGLVLGGSVGVLIWLTATVLIWRESAAERADRVRQQGKGTVACVKCGYNMTGLREPRCPECGTVYTLDQLLIAQNMEQAETTLADQEST